VASGEYYLEFRQVPFDGRLTKKIDVISTRSGEKLGRIAWFGRWRQYVFYPEPKTIFNPDCLDAINRKIRALMEERRG
jgi:hypothetical protein